MASVKENPVIYEPKIRSAIRRYRWVIAFPSFRCLLGMLFATSICSWLLSFVFLGSDLGAIYTWIFAFTIAPLLLDAVFLQARWCGSPIMDRRRLVAVSLTCNVAFLGCAFLIGSVGSVLSQDSLVRAAVLLGMSVHFFVRLAALSTLGVPRLRAGTTSVYFFFMFTTAVQSFPPTRGGLGWIPAVAASWLLSLLLYSLSLAAINSVGIRSIGVPSSVVFHAYLKSRLIGETHDLERILDKLGEQRDIVCWLIVFQDREGRDLLALASTSAHFGPFDRVGSSGLSHELRLALQARLHCPLIVLRELSDHSMDLVSRRECENLIRDFPLERQIEGLTRCSPLVTETFRDHVASSLVADGLSLTILSRAPIPAEDLPSSVRSIVLRDLSSLGFEASIVVDAHNCIGDLLGIAQDIEAEHFREAVRRSVVEASKRIAPFQVGFCRITPPGISLDDGLGPDGLSAVVFKCGSEVSSLVVIDGNNMIVGLRERIREALSDSLIVRRSEVITTDTHLVTGLSRVQGGYNPLGIGVDQQLLVQLCREAVAEAMVDIKPASISIASGVVRGIRVVGSGLIRLAELLDASLSATKRYLVASICIAAILSYAISVLI